jgi:hypothetical protein
MSAIALTRGFPARAPRRLAGTTMVGGDHIGGRCKPRAIIVRALSLPPPLVALQGRVRFARRANQRFCVSSVLRLVQPVSEKFFASRFGRNSFTDSPVPRSSRGALRDRHECWVRDAVDVRARQTNAASRGRRSRVVLAPRRWRQVHGLLHERRGQESPVPEKSTKETVKTIRAGKAG